MSSRTEGQEKFECPYCDEAHTSGRELRKHVGANHKDKVDDFALDHRGGHPAPVEKRKIVILGAGVAGLLITLKLKKRLDPSDITLIDENDYHQYLYHLQKVCNADYEENEIIIPLSKTLKDERIDIRKTSVISISPSKRIVQTVDGAIRFDTLVVALGSKPNYFGVEGSEHSLVLDSYDNAKKIRESIIDVFEAVKKKGKYPRVVIGGAGMTGVELAGEIADWYSALRSETHTQLNGKYKLCDAFGEELDFLAEMDSHVLETDLTKKNITLVELTDGILPGWDRRLAKKGEEKLRQLGVNLSFGDGIARIDEDSVHLASGRTIPYDLFIWTCGVKGNPIATKEFESTRGRVIVDDYCMAKGYNNIYVAGDCAHVTDDEGNPCSPTAHIAMEHADIVAHNIIAKIEGKKLKKYEFSRIGEIVTIGRTFATADLFGVKFSGPLAKFMKKMVHLWYLWSIGGLMA